MPLDGVFFALHGAMAAGDPYTDAEGELLRAAREAVGEAVPFVATYDFHGIMTHDECAELAAAFPNDTNPHIDNYERGLEASCCMLRILDGEIQPVTRVVHIPIIGPNIGQSTWSHDADEEERLPLYQLNLIREAMEDTPGVINLTIMGGYGYADTPESRMSVIATTDGDPDRAQRMAGELSERVWQRREDILNVRPIYPIDEGVRMAIESDEEKPVVLVDLGDDPGSATPSDSPAVLESLIRQGARDCVVTIRDPNVVDAAVEAGVGAELEIEAGASIDQRFYPPLTIRGYVKTIDDGKYMICGPTHGGWGREVNRAAWREEDAGLRVVLRLANRIDVIFTKGRTRNDRDFMKSAGILFEEKKIIVVKSNQAHRASLRPVVSKIIELATPGASTVDYESLPFRHLQRPLWPVDRDFHWTVDDGVRS
ncbi:M81 family metallopeptidase [soil metagenome]